MDERRVPKMASKSNARKKHVMTDEHKKALARGREESRLIDMYLTALAADAPKPGRQRTVERVKKELESVNMKLQDKSLSPISALKLQQKQIDLTAELSAKQEVSALDELELAFISIAKGFSERQGISYRAWRAVGVPPNPLREAGITPK